MRGYQNKKLNEMAEFVKIQKMYENNTGIHDRMDLIAFAQKYYDDLIKKFTDCRQFWTSERLSNFFAKSAT